MKKTKKAEHKEAYVWNSLKENFDPIKIKQKIIKN